MNRFVVTETAVIDAPVERVWEVISRTDRYAEWVAGAIEVTDHHGVATIGKTYSERNRTIGPLKTDSVWTVEEIMARSADAVWERSEADGIDARLAANAIAIERVAEATRLRGLYP